MWVASSARAVPTSLTPLAAFRTTRSTAVVFARTPFLPARQTALADVMRSGAAAAAPAVAAAASTARRSVSLAAAEAYPAGSSSSPSPPPPSPRPPPPSPPPAMFVELKKSEGQERELLRHVKATTPANDPHAVVKAIDQYGWSSPNFFMNVGDVKGLEMDAALREANPISALELGTYCGYSAVRIGSQLSRPGARLVSVDISPAHADIAREMLAHAGLLDRVTVVVGTLQSAVNEVRKSASKVPFDFVFIDHEKSVYLSDLKFLMEQELIGPGTVVLADNVLYPGAPDYRDWMKKSDRFRTMEIETALEYKTNVKDIMVKSVYLGPSPAL